MIEPLRDDLMVQQQLPDGLDTRVGVWQHMVAVIMLNQTGRKPVKTVLPQFLDRWRTHYAFYRAFTNFDQAQEIQDIIRPLGMVNVRYKRLTGMTQDFLDWDGVNAADLYGIGRYGSDSYEIFFKQNYTVEPTDKELRRYLAEEIKPNWDHYSGLPSPSAYDA
jgi:methyl-CpG-binding domain protein 4